MRRGRTLGLVPAKIGSVRLPRKNLLPLAGVSLVGRAVLAGLRSGACDAVVVSTDDDEIAAEGRRWGAQIVRRPEGLGRDPAGVVDVALHALDALAAAGQTFDTLVVLLPTSPLRRPEDVAAAMARYDRGEEPFLLTAVEVGVAPLRALIVDEFGRAVPLHPEWLHRTGARASGDLPRLVRHDGSVAVCSAPALAETGSLYGPPLAVHLLPTERDLDIDTPADFERARRLFLAGLPDWIAAADRPITER